ncbi:hypothetical protein MPLSOD_20167 [Mesorhizobium sp. SOD10]|nr:hypothetical protein MPLSOD_20167 [Mesorhizobium sp. SOD10]
MRRATPEKSRKIRALTRSRRTRHVCQDVRQVPGHPGELQTDAAEVGPDRCTANKRIFLVALKRIVPSPSVIE